APGAKPGSSVNLYGKPGAFASRSAFVSASFFWAVATSGATAAVTMNETPSSLYVHRLTLFVPVSSFPVLKFAPVSLLPSSTVTILQGSIEVGTAVASAADACGDAASDAVGSGIGGSIGATGTAGGRP